MTAAREWSKPRPPLTDAQRRMVSDNLGLVGIVIKPSWPDYDDAFQDGVLGLMRATQKFEPERGFRFSTYAMYWIRQAVGRGTIDRLGGLNAQHTYRNGGRFEFPLSLDMPQGDDDSRDLAGLLVADSNVEGDALSCAALDEMADRLLAVCSDDLDVAIVTELVAGPRKGWLQRVADEQHRDRQTVDYRFKRLRARISERVLRELAA